MTLEPGVAARAAFMEDGSIQGTSPANGYGFQEGVGPRRKRGCVTLPIIGIRPAEIQPQMEELGGLLEFAAGDEGRLPAFAHRVLCDQAAFDILGRGDL